MKIISRMETLRDQNEIAVTPPRLVGGNVLVLANGHRILRLENALDASESPMSVMREDGGAIIAKVHTFSCYHEHVRDVDARHWTSMDVTRTTAWSPERVDTHDRITLLIDSASSALMLLASHSWLVEWQPETMRIKSIFCTLVCNDDDAASAASLHEASWLAALARKEQRDIMAEVYSRRAELKPKGPLADHDPTKEQFGRLLDKLKLGPANF